MQLRWIQSFGIKQSSMKQTIKKALRALGVEIRRIHPEWDFPDAGSRHRPVGNIEMFLEDVRARGFKPAGILDIGANCGDWTRMALSVFPESRVIMFEPQEEMRLKLEAYCSENSNVECIHAGAGKEDGELIQTIWKDLKGSSFLPKADQAKIDQGRQRITPIVTVDSVLGERPDFVPDLVKLDIQGFELEALRGATAIFGLAELIILETSLYEFLPGQPLTIDCFNFMKAKGYNFYDVADYIRRPLDGALGQIDIAFAKSNGMLRESRLWSPQRAAKDAQS